MSTVSKDNELIQSIYKYLKDIGQKDAAKLIAKNNNIDEKKIKLDSLVDLSNLYQLSKKRPIENSNGNASKKAKVDSDSDSDDDSDDSDDSDEDKPLPVIKQKSAAVVTEKTIDSDSDSDSDDDESDDEPVQKAPTKAVPTASKPTPKVIPATKPTTKPADESDSDSDDSSSSSSSSSDSDEEPVKPVPKKVAAPIAKKPSSSSDSTSSSEDEEEPQPVIKKPIASTNVQTPKTAIQPTTPATAPISTSSTPGKEFKVYVKGLPWSAKEKDVENFFKSCGKVSSVECPLDENGRSSGTAYVRFPSRNELDKALELDGQTWPGTERWLKISESTDTGRKSFSSAPQQPGVRPEGCNTIFIGNLSWDVTEDLIRDTFSKIGEITQIRFANDEEGNFKGFGHVEFADGEATVEAVKLYGTVLAGRAIRVDYAPPRNRESTGGGRGGRGGDRGGGGRGGRGGGRSNNNTPTFNKNKGTIAGASSAGKKTTFDD